MTDWPALYRWREGCDRQQWIDGLRRRWNLVTAEGLPPAGRTLTDDVLSQIRCGLMSVEDGRREFGLDPWRLEA